MRALITPEMYRSHNEDCELSDTELEKVLDVAQQTVYVQTRGRLERFDNFPENVRENVLKAIMAQADYVSENFGTELAGSMPESASIGSFSYSLGGSSESDTVTAPSALNDTARMYLQFTGLLYRGVACAF